MNLTQKKDEIVADLVGTWSTTPMYPMQLYDKVVELAKEQGFEADEHFVCEILNLAMQVMYF